jgi:hypothetical protein
MWGAVRPTVTDANVVLGFLNSPICWTAICRSMRGKSAWIPLSRWACPGGGRLGHSCRRQCCHDAGHQAVSSEISRSPGDFVMVAFGAMARCMAQPGGPCGHDDIIIPASGVFSALGLFARIQHRLVSGRGAMWTNRLSAEPRRFGVSIASRPYGGGGGAVDRGELHWR